MSPKRLKQNNSMKEILGTNDGRLEAPSATRNLASILEVLKQFVSKNARVLEIASGTGQHIVQYAREFPKSEWQPTDVDPVRITSIRSWARQSPLPNLRDPILLDAVVPGWSNNQTSWNLIMMTNLLHLISSQEVAVVVKEASQALAPGGTMFIYGPFKRGSDFASNGDRAFDASLRSQDASVGYESFQDIQALQVSSGLVCEPVFEMPANNLILVARKR